MKVSASAGRQAASKTARATFAAPVRKALESQSTLLTGPSTVRSTRNGSPRSGSCPEARFGCIRNSEELALSTGVGDAAGGDRDNSADGPRRAAAASGPRTSSTPPLTRRCPHPSLSDDDAQACSEFVERLDDDGCQQGLVALAPHGGAMERHTDSQAERVGSLLGGKRASVWRCRGFKAGGGALERWHITASEISDASFPLLRTIASRGFCHAVAFHGFTKPGVLVGGAAPPPLKEAIAAALTKALASSGIQVRIAGPSDKFDGDNPSNIVNRLTAGGANGVQIEQSLDARTGFWQAIADAVAAVYRYQLPAGSVLDRD